MPVYLKLIIHVKKNRYFFFSSEFQGKVQEMNLFSEPLLPNYFDIEICIKKKKTNSFSSLKPILD